jgi:hypothetical protein
MLHPTIRPFRLHATRVAAVVVTSLLVACSGSPAKPTPGPGLPPGPPATYTLSGIVTDPAGDVVAGARIASGAKSVTTDASGRFTIAELIGRIDLQISKEGYEPRIVELSMNQDHVLGVTLVPVLRIEPGEPVTLTMYPGEPGYDFGPYYEYCDAPCKLFRVRVPGAGSMSIRLAPRDATRRLSVYANHGLNAYYSERQVILQSTFSAPGEVVVHVTLDGGLGLDARIDVLPTFHPRN